ncbi:sugar efflux transporter [Vibrio tapetis]|uniref:Major facilitator family protein n=1 Tax=Vibrio tapetis subsp. tapetis TaxID=1671868 RepID=A0A2N8ZKV8_9VIBR|nr:sugar efflux transporter [Vibrio tapetis]SON52522.1 Major facilitator family protein [Vibrio tapetis subsp. tapetis]
MLKKLIALMTGQSGVYFIINGLTALAFAFLMPIMSLFLVTALKTEPIFLGLYTATVSLMTIFISQKLTGMIDKGVSSKKLFLMSLSGIVAASFGFSLATEFWHALVVGALLMPFASSSIPLILTMIRNYADSTGKDSAKINSQMRSSVSLLWIFGPPLAFLSVDTFGFDINFYLSMGIASLVMVIVATKLQVEGSKNKTQSEDKGKSIIPTEVWVLCAIMMIANMANAIYINSMPLFVTNDLKFPTSYPGLMLGITAAIEIPVMLLAVKWSKRWGKTGVMKLGFVAAATFYIGMFFAETLPMLLALQILNGLFFGVFVGLGITIVQDYAPSSIGRASALYTNAMLIGTMLGTSSMGLISQYYGFKAPLLLSFIAVITAGIGMWVHEANLAKKTKAKEVVTAK